MTQRKLNVAVLAGGRSSEHDISRMSAINIIEALDSERFSAVPVLIERSGDWRLTTPNKLMLTTGAPTPSTSIDDDNELSADGTVTMPTRRREVRPATVTSPSNALRGVDVIFPVLHGPFGEDGTIQGLLETAGVPYVGNGVLASAVGMDKAIFKAVLRDAGISVAPGIVAHKQREKTNDVVTRATSELSFPMFIKPARLGSSIGISRAENEAELSDAIELAFSHDAKILIEAAVIGVEVECGVLGNENPIVSVPGEISIADDAPWYDFETKYSQGRAELHIPARISEKATKAIQDTALKVFQVLECSGLARIDCFVTPDEKVIVNEVNTMPGCTPTSAYAKLFAAGGYSFDQIVTRLVDLAIERHAANKELMY